MDKFAKQSCLSIIHSKLRFHPLTGQSPSFFIAFNIPKRIDGFNKQVFQYKIYNPAPCYITKFFEKIIAQKYNIVSCIYSGDEMKQH